MPNLRQDYTALSEEDWRKQYETTQHLGHEHFRVVRWGMGNYLPLLHARC